MADLLVRLQGQDNLSGTLNNAKNSINQFGNTASQIDKVRERFQRIDESTAPLRKKLNDVKREMEKLAAAGETNSQVFTQMAQAARRYQEQLNQVSQAIRDTDSKMDKFKNILTDVANKAGFGSIAGELTALAGPAGVATAGIAAVGYTMVEAAKAANDFEKHLDGLQALTGLDDSGMKAVSDGAIEMSKKFRSSAGEIVDAMKLIGSQAPELLANKDALMEVTSAANVLAEAAEITVEDAASGLTTVMNQMGVSASEAGSIINTLAAASQQGSADVAYLKTAFEKSGTAASSAGMTYTELAAAIETVGPKFSSADVAGSQLASTLLQLSMKAKSEFQPAVVGMSTALENMAKANMSDAEMAKLVGESNVTMLKTLIDGKATFTGYAQSLKGTNTAYEQMAINNDNWDGKVAHLKNTWDAFLITLGQSAWMKGIVDNVESLLELLGSLCNSISDIISAFDGLGVDGVKNVNILKIQIDFLRTVLEGLGTAIEIVVRLVVKAFDWIQEKVGDVADWVKTKWDNAVASFADTSFGRAIMQAWVNVYNKAQEMIAKVKQLWNDFLSWLGMETKSTGGDLTPETLGGGDSSTDTSTGTKTKKKGGSSSKKNPKKKGNQTPKKEKPDEGTQGYYEEKVQEIDKQLKNKKLSDERVEQLKKEKAEYEKIIEALKIRNGLVDKKETKKEEVKGKEGSLKDVQDKIQETKTKLNLEVAGSDEYKKLEKELLELQNKEYKIRVEVEANRPKTQEEIDKAAKQAAEDAAKAKQKADEEAKQLKEKHEQMIQQMYQGSQKIASAFMASSDQMQKNLSESAQKNIETLMNFSGRLDALSTQITDCGLVFQDSLSTGGEKAGAALTMAGQALAAFAGQGEAAKIAAVMSAIGQLILGYATATAQAASMGPWAWAAFAVSGLATVVTTIAALKSQSKGYATGGIIEGGSVSGDRILARVNAGEMILNKKQQANLFRMLDSGVVGNTLTVANVKIKGSDIYLALNNYNSKMNKIR